jgi:hypothetical protein
MHVPVLSLTDGGPFDNLGVTALLDERCNYVIASDTGALFDNRQGKGAVGRLGMMRRLSEMLMYRPAQLYRHDLNERRRMGNAAEADADGDGPSALAQFAASRELRGLAAFRIAGETDGRRPPAVDPRLIMRTISTCSTISRSVSGKKATSWRTSTFARTPGQPSNTRAGCLPGACRSRCIWSGRVWSASSRLAGIASSGP